MKTKVWKYVSVMICTAMLLGSCSPSPKKTAQKFAEHMAMHQYQDAKKYCTQGAAQWVDIVSNLSVKQQIAANYQFKLIKDSVKGNEAWIDYLDVDGDTAQLYVVKLDGKWLVDEGGK